MNKIVITSFLGVEDYYNLYHASKIINSSILKQKEKDSLLEFLKKTSSMRSISKSKNEYS